MDQRFGISLGYIAISRIERPERVGRENHELGSDILGRRLG